MRRIVLAVLCVLAAFLSAAALALACNPQAHLTLNSTVAKPGQTITAYGSYFPGNADITVITPTGSYLVKTSAGGSFAMDFTAPTTPGSYLVSAIRPTGGAASVSFTVAQPPSPPPKKPTEAPLAVPPPLPHPTLGRAQTLSKRQALRDVRAAVRAKFNTAVRRRPGCRRISRLVFSCRAPWVDTWRHYSGKVTISRSGLATSPIDRFRIRARSTSRLLGSRRHRMHGRIVVKARRAHIGQTLQLLGAKSTSTELEVTAGPMIDPFLANGVGQPAAGTRHVAIWMQLRNLGMSPHSDSAAKGAKLVTTAGNEIPAVLTPVCPGTVEVLGGQTRVACVVFDVPAGVSARQLEYRADAGSGRETGSWRLP